LIRDTPYKGKKPGKYLFSLSIAGLIITIALPNVPFGTEVGLFPLPFINFGAMLLIVAAYIITADLLKIWFFKKYRSI